MDVDFLILADAAQAIGGKIYVLGGGWDVLTVNQPFPVRQPFAIAIGLSVPWNETNQRHNVTVEILDEDGESQAAPVAGQLEVGRPPGVPVGDPQRVVLAVDGTLNLAGPGKFVIVAKVEEQETKRVGFRVLGGLGVQSPS